MKGREGRVLFPFYNHCPQKESSAREHQPLKFNPQCPAPLIWSVLYRLRSLSELTILTWKKISNKDICDPISHAGPHSSGAPLVFIVMEMMLFANWLLHPPQATFPTTISLTRRVSPLIWIPSILWPVCCLCTYEGFKGNTIQHARVSQNMWKFS